MSTRQERLLEIALEAVVKLKDRVDSAVQLSKGDKGDKGETGEPGPKGDMGERGPKGDQGPMGLPGRAGRDGLDGVDGLPGRNGRDGKDGRDGQDGAAGPAGADGKDGADGRDGIDGRGVAQTEIKNGDLLITYTDGERFNVGRVVGDNGSTQTVIKGRKGGAELPNTGWAQYLDTEFTEALPFVLSDGVISTLPNNAGNNITNYLPDGVTLYDPLTQKLTPGAVGDYNAITIRFNAETSSTSTYLEFGIDTGNPAGPIFADIKVFPKGAGVKHPFTFTCLGFSLNNFTGNGGIVKLTAVGGDVEVYDINYHFARLLPV